MVISKNEISIHRTRIEELYKVFLLINGEKHYLDNIGRITEEKSRMLMFDLSELMEMIPGCEVYLEY